MAIWSWVYGDFKDKTELKTYSACLEAERSIEEALISQELKDESWRVFFFYI